jgi:tetratricopeptide (TPR) repeat protein
VVDASNTGLTLVNEGDTEEGLKYLQSALDDAIALDKIESNYWQETSQFLLSDAYNSMGYANLLNGDITLSLEYLNQALRIEPNYSYEYSNKASALGSQYEYEEALTYYDLALQENVDESYAYYGKGEVYYNQGNYDKAIHEFETYQRYEPKDIDAIWYLTYCYYYLKDTDRALKFLDKSIKENKEAVELYLAKADLYEQTKTYEEARIYSENITGLFKSNIDVQLNLGEFYYNHAEYQTALEYYSKIKEDFPDNADIDSWIIACYREENKLEEAGQYIAKRLEDGTATGQLLMDLGNAYTSNTLFMEAIPYFEEALRIDSELEDAAVNIIYSLYSANRFVRAIEYGEQAEAKFSDNYDIPYYIGDCYYSMGEYEKAAEAYLRALELSPENDDLMAFIGECYLMMEDYTKAERYTEDALELDYYDETAMNIKELLEIRKLPINEQIRRLYEDNYLYYDEEEGKQKKLKELFAEEDMTAFDVAVAVDRMRLPEDIFTFTLYDEYYTSLYVNAEDDVEYKKIGDINYIRFYSFDQYTDSKVIQVLDSIQNSEEEILTLDLRGNGGGLLSGAVNILDVLLPECTICTDFDREGYNESYYSDASQIKFKKIYILVDENSASASELVTLSLKSYLSNVTILGRNTFGKGVGQIAYEDKSRNLVVFLVSSYWNVREHNIMGSNIKPDLYMESDELEDYLSVMRD